MPRRLSVISSADYIKLLYVVVSGFSRTVTVRLKADSTYGSGPLEQGPEHPDMARGLERQHGLDEPPGSYDAKNRRR